MRQRISLALVFGLMSTVITSATAQSSLKNKPTVRLPRVGIIKDYPATGMMTGCGNLYFEFPKKTGSLTTEYVFLSRGDGNDGWLNLDGRDTHLNLLRTDVAKKAVGKTNYYYRLGKTQITVSIINSGRFDDDYPLRLTITLRRGRSVRRVRAIGSSDC